ncbi:MAG: hypothetical protein JJU02_14635, partial [Cryomorphaceae bacterium]|nr:hypothetical protein [Cryomorphaceae bacterium]
MIEIILFGVDSIILFRVGSSFMRLIVVFRESGLGAVWIVDVIWRFSRLVVVFWEWGWVRFRWWALFAGSEVGG